MKLIKRELRWLTLAVLGITLIVGAHRARAQKAADPKLYPLSPEASSAIMQLEAQRKACSDEINQRESDIFLGARIPIDSRQCKWGEDKIVVCSKPSPTPSPK